MSMIKDNNNNTDCFDIEGTRPDNGTNDASCDYVHISREALAFNAILNLTTMAVGLVCNTCVIFTVAKTKHLRRSSINRAVVNLCIADLVTICLDLPLTTSILVGNYYQVMVRNSAVVKLENQAFQA